MYFAISSKSKFLVVRKDLIRFVGVLQPKELQERRRRHRVLAV